MTGRTRQGDLAEQAVDALGDLYGRHPGSRAAHARGVVCHGTFAATPEAARLCVAPHLQGQPLDVTVRFSNASGDPAADDRRRDARGMAATFHLPGGGRTDLVAVTLRCFPARTPEDFLALTRARASRRSVRWLRLLRFVARHPESLRSLLAVVSTPPPASHAGCAYNAIHSFRWLAADGRKRHVRYRWVPHARAPGRPGDLRAELAARLEREPVRFTLEVDLAAAGERVDDPTAVWKPRRTVEAGVLELTALGPAPDAGGSLLTFDPMRLIEGIEPSEDPVLHFRPHAYDVSVRRRSTTVGTQEAPRR